MRRNAVLIVTAACILLLGRSPATPAQEEPELVIAKYGKVLVQSAVPGARVYVDDLYKEPAGTIIEKILAGDHVISVRTDTQVVSGSFTVKKNELLKLEARFQEGKLVSVVEQAKVEKPEPPAPPKVEETPKAEKLKPEKPKKTAPPPPPPPVAAKKEEPKDPEAERRALHLNLMHVFFTDNADTHRLRVTHKANSAIITRFQEKKHETGTYYRTRQNLLLCETGPCEQQWSSTFLYTDEAGKSDSFALTWKQIVFTGITPTGISERILLFCLNGDCTTLEDKSNKEFAVVERDIGRYNIRWSKASLFVRRADIMNIIRAAGGDIEAFSP